MRYAIRIMGLVGVGLIYMASIPPSGPAAVGLGIIIGAGAVLAALPSQP